MTSICTDSWLLLGLGRGLRGLKTCQELLWWRGATSTTIVIRVEIPSFVEWVGHAEPELYSFIVLLMSPVTARVPDEHHACLNLSRLLPHMHKLQTTSRSSKHVKI